MKKGLERKEESHQVKSGQLFIDEPDWMSIEYNPVKLPERFPEPKPMEPEIGETDWKPKKVTPESPPNQVPGSKPGEPEPKLPVDE